MIHATFKAPMGSFATYDDERCAVGPFGLNGSSDKLVRLPSLTVSTSDNCKFTESITENTFSMLDLGMMNYQILTRI